MLTATAGSQTRGNTYNGDGVLVAQTANGTTTRYAQDLAAPLSQILQAQGSTTTTYLYGMDRLAAISGSTRSWYSADALGSVRRMLSDTGAAVGSVVNYDPWGTPEGTAQPPAFGFTGELQDSATGLVNLRARWYHTQHGTFTTFRWQTSESLDEIPYSHHPYQYVYSNPILHTDPTGKCVPEADGPRACRASNSEQQPIQPECYYDPSRVVYEGKGRYPQYVCHPWHYAEYYLPSVKAAASTFGIPWQVVAGVLEAEITLDTDWYDRAQDALFRTPVVGGEVGLAIFGENAGFGLGNIHFPTARTVAEYISTCYRIELPGWKLGWRDFSQILSEDDVNIQYIAGNGSGGRDKRGRGLPGPICLNRFG